MQLTAQATVQRYSASGNGDVSPSLVITLPGAFNPWAIKTDSSGNIYVSGAVNNANQTPELLEYSASSSTLLRTLTVDDIGPVVIDATGQIYLGGAFTNMVYVYPANSTGTATASRKFSFTPTPSPANGDLLVDIALDSAGNVYLDYPNLMSLTSTILELSGSANGTTAATRVLPISGFSRGVVVDASGNIYTTNSSYLGKSAGSIQVFGSSATPTRTATLPNSNQELGGLQLDAVGNVYALGLTVTAPNTFTHALYEIGPTQSGVITPAATQTSTAFTSNMGYQIAAF